MVRLTDALNAVVLRAGDICLAISAVVILFLAVVGSADVLGTYLFLKPVPVARELSAELLVLLIFGALPRVERMRRHIEVDLVMERMPGLLQRLSRVLALATGLAVFLVLAQGALAMATESYEYGEFAAAVIRFPVWPIKVVFAAMVVTSVAEYLRQIVVAISTIRHPTRATEGGTDG
ncbi:TRAP transporter small permease [Salipiger mucosus]|uniref:TRAP transporter small permease protein n=1 Tax=Salipiger mucosus DSM 16094 TaxID=1123237 RepID=S9S7Q5_9RHOB|nr:TRAP transporter small permease [Salipiger mucosus]EPX82274.1 putative TRAP-T family transporter DctQ subunit [Salipiger mucosus DSM 16094]